MIATVNGKEVPPDEFVLEGIVLSSYRPPGQPKPCSFEIPIGEFLAVLEKPYKDLVRDLKRPWQHLTNRLAGLKKSIERKGQSVGERLSTP